MIHVDAIAYQSPYKQMLQKSRIITTFLILITGIMIDEPILYLFSMVIASLVVLILSKADFLTFVKLLSIPMFFIGTTSLMIMVDITRTMPEKGLMIQLINGYHLVMTPSHIFFAFKVFLRSLSSMMLVFSLSLTIPMVGIIDFLKFMRVPEAFVHLFALSYRMVFVTIEIALDLVCASQLRYGYVSPLRTFKSVSMMASVLFLRMLQRTEEMDEAMQIRFYHEVGS